MWIWNKLIKPILEAVGHFESLSAIKTLLWPFILTAGTAVSGYLGHAPIMWIIMAGTLTFMGASVGILAASYYRERQNPLNKLMIRNTIFFHNLADPPQHNRQTRQGSAKAKVVVPLPPRRLTQGQLGLDIVNTASFPLSIIVKSANSKIEGMMPPRSSYPKKPIILQPGGFFWVHDESIELNLPCGVLKGELELTIAYGIPGNEKYIISRKGTVEIFLQDNGLLQQVYFHPDPDSLA